jgi:Ca2+:H+ antiporter
MAIVGNPAEYSTAILVAMKNSMDLSLAIAMGVVCRLALLVAPVMVLSYFVGPRPMDLVFTPAEVLAVYVILTIVFFFLPDTTAGGAH